jgi:hypothetical protein
VEVNKMGEEEKIAAKPVSDAPGTRVIVGDNVKEKILTAAGKHPKKGLYLNSKMLKDITSKIKHELRVLRDDISKQWNSQPTKDLLEAVVFIASYGLVGIGLILSILTLTHPYIPLIAIILNNPFITFVVYTLGVGGGYYLFLDVNDALHNIWKKK